jgi:hypothetical protein
MSTTPTTPGKRFALSNRTNTSNTAIQNKSLLFSNIFDNNNDIEEISCSSKEFKKYKNGKAKLFNFDIFNNNKNNSNEYDKENEDFINIDDAINSNDDGSENDDNVWDIEYRPPPVQGFFIYSIFLFTFYSIISIQFLIITC